MSTVAVAVLVLLIGATTAWAYWTAAATAGSAGRSVAGTLPQVTGVVPGTVTGSDVPLTWNAATPAGGPAVSYLVRRYDGATATVACNSDTVQVTATSCTDSAPLGVFTYTVTGRLNAWSGPESVASAPASTDVVVPNVAVTFPTAAGTYNTAGWNAGCSSAICGTASDNHAVQRVEVTLRRESGGLYWNGSAFSSATSVALTATGTTAWAYPFAAANFPADGSYTVTATAVDRSGNRSTIGSRTFVRDTVAPTVTLTSPTSGQRTNDTTPTLTGAAGTATGDGGTVTIKIHSGTSTAGTVVQTHVATVVAGGWSVDASPALAEGTYTVQVAQSDAAGNTGLSTATSFAVDTTPPAGLTLTTPADGSLTNDSTPTLAGAAGSATGDHTSVLVDVYSGSTATGTPVQTRSATRSGSTWSVEASPSLMDGTWTARARQSDSAGNSSTSGPVTFTVDTVAPVVTMTTPASGSQTNDATPTVGGAAGNLAGDATTVTVKIWAGDSPGGPPVVPLFDTTRIGGTWTGTAPTLPDGVYSAWALQSDAAGNTTTSPRTVFTVDTAPPAVTLTTPAAGAFTNDTTPTLSGAAGNATGDGSAVSVEIFGGSTATGTPLQTLSVTRSAASWSTSASPALPEGTYTARAAQSDSAGNAGTTATRTFVVDTTAPAPTQTTPANGSGTNDLTPTLSGIAGDALGDATSVTIRIWLADSTGTSPVQTLTATRVGGTWSVDALTLNDGKLYLARIRQQDSAGNVGETDVTFRTDTRSPSVTLTVPVDGSVTNSTTPTLGGAASNDTGDSSTVTVRIYQGSTTGGTLLQTLTPTRTTTTWSTSASPALAEGTYTAQATQSDDAGNTGTSSARTFTVDTTAPPQPTITAAPTDPTISPSAGFSFTDSEAGVSFRCSLDGGSFTTCSSPTSYTGLTDGVHTFQVVARDAALNSSTPATHSWRVDTTPPSVTLTTPADGSAVNTSTPTLSGAAGNATGDSTTVTVRIYSGTDTGGTLLQTLTATRSTTTWSTAPSPALPDGTYTARATQTDTAGHTGTSATSTFTVDTAAPAPTIGAPLDGSTVDNASPVTLSGTAGTATRDLTTVTVRIYNGTGTQGTLRSTITLTATAGNWSTTTDLEAGTYTLQASQSDSPGNTGSSSAHTVTVTDTTAPLPTVTAPADGSITSSATPTISGTAGQRSGDQPTMTITIYNGSETGGTVAQVLVTTASGGAWSTSPSPGLPVGVYTVDASQTDTASNTGVSQARTFTIAP